MAVDEAVVEAVDAGTAAPTLRLYRWSPPCLSLGFSQSYDVADAAFCRTHGVDLVRRPTGGRAVLHHLELTYSVSAPLGRGPFSLDLQQAYGTICEALVAGLRRLGVDAELATEPPGGHLRPNQAIPCFIGPAAGEVVTRGRKLVGSAMRRAGDSILQHGSLLEDWDGTLQAGCLGLGDDGELRGAVTTLRETLGAVPAHAALGEALVAGVRDALGVEIVAGSLSEDERARADLLAGERYGHARWTVGRDRWLPPA